MAACAGVQNVSRPIERCQEMSQMMPTLALVAATSVAATYQGRCAASGGARVPGGAAAVIGSLVPRASSDQSLAAPLLEDLLDLLVRVVQRLLGGHPARGRVGEHSGEDEGVEHLALGRVRRSRVSDVGGPLQGGTDRLELGGRVRAERIVRRLLHPPLVARRG